MLIQFHRFLIAVAILFGGFFTYKLYSEWERLNETSMLLGAICSGLITLGLALYLPCVKARRPAKH
jgi:hypothetical protein